MCANWRQKMENNASPLIRTVRIVLLVLIIVGIGLILTKDTWVPKLVDYILIVKYQDKWFLDGDLPYGAVLPAPLACTMEAKICPDGSAVGRQGPSCEFAACPTNATSTEVVALNKNIVLAVGQKEKVSDLTITLNAFVQDSRCPIDVTCIQAGAVNVNLTLADASHTITKNFSSDEAPYHFGRYSISIVDIAPARESKKEILANQYKITFHVVSDAVAY